MQLLLCRHIKTNGMQCHAIALKGTPLCYFHTRLHRSHREATTGRDFQLGPLEDRDAVQIAISQTAAAIATGQLDTERARLLIAALRLASANAPRQLPQRPPDVAYASYTVETTADHLELAGPQEDGSFYTVNEYALEVTNQPPTNASSSDREELQRTINDLLTLCAPTTPSAKSGLEKL